MMLMSGFCGGRTCVSWQLTGGVSAPSQGGPAGPTPAQPSPARRAPPRHRPAAAAPGRSAGESPPGVPQVSPARR